MPKLKKPAGRYDKLRQAISGAACVKHGGHVDLASLAAESGFSYMTLRRRMQQPEMLTLDELRRIARALDIAVADLLACVTI